MLMNIKDLVVFIFFISIFTFSQNSIVGIVLDNQDNPLPNTSIISIDKKYGVISAVSYTHLTLPTKNEV